MKTVLITGATGFIGSRLCHVLHEKGARVSYNDPYIPSILLSQDTMSSVELTEECLSSADCVVIATDHSCYQYQYIADMARLIFDARGATGGLKGGNIIRL